jgi:hypothetical protein
MAETLDRPEKKVDETWIGRLWRGLKPMQFT